MNPSSMKRLAAISILLLCVLTTVGCSGKPKGFPSVKRCVVNVTDGGTPVADVEVVLSPAQVMSGTIVGGKTDANGECAVTTTFANFSAVGAPAGEYTLVLKKEPVVDDMPDLTPEQAANMSRADVDKYYKERSAKIASMPKIVPVNLTSFQSSPVRINVPGDEKISVDLAEYK